MPLTQTKSKGVGVVVARSIFDDEDGVMKSQENRMVSVQMKLTESKQCVKLASIYCPNELNEQREFLEEINMMCNGEKNIIIGADVNCDLVNDKKRLCDAARMGKYDECFWFKKIKPKWKIRF